MKGDIKVTVRYVEPSEQDMERHDYYMEMFLKGVMQEWEEKKQNADRKQEKVYKVA